MAHESLFNTVERHLPLPGHAAGLLAVHDLDARAGLGAARLRRGAGVPGDASPTPSSSRSAAGAEVEGFMLEAARAVAAHYVHETRRPTASRTGTPARPGLARAAGTPRAAGRSLQRPRAGRRLRRRRSRRRACCGSAAGSSGQGEAEDGRLLFQAGLTVARTLLGAPYLSDDAAAPGPAAALGLPPAERLGLRARPGARSRAASRASGATTTCASWRCYVQRLADDEPYYTFFGPRASA